MAEIKIRELSIGDWVKANGVAKRVHSIEYQNGAYFVNFSDTDTNSEDYMHAPLVKPIPLTPEILEKNGWYDLMKLVDDDDDVEYNTYCDWKLEPNICGTIYGVGGKFHLGDGVEYHKFVELQYVHQLQHALRLAGVEKEIEL